MEKSTVKTKRLDWPVIIFMTIVHGIALYSLQFFSLQNLAIAFVLYIATAGGITLGYHRLFTHRAFKVPKWLEYIIGIMGTLAYQGGIREWVAHHRMHHAFSDSERDPHDASQGFWHSHMGWILTYNDEVDDMATLKKYARDIESDRFLRFLSSDYTVFFLQVLLGVLLFGIFGLEAMLWGIFVRLVFVYHVTWFVNSAAHKFGYRTYDVNDRATNCWWVGLLALGEGWHNNHHANGSCAHFGHKWWELDLTFQAIRVLKFLGLATDINLKGWPRATQP